MRLFGLLLSSLISISLLAQPAKGQMSQAEYIETYKEDAIREMNRSGVPASITLAQGILESGNGNSSLARIANNHFGIKCHSDWDGPTYIQDDDAKDECFRKYKDPLESFEDHSDFLKKPRYAELFELKITDYKGWAHGLKKAGYATNPKYPKLLIDIIEKNELYQYDKGGKQLASEKKSKSRKPNNSAMTAAIAKSSSSHHVQLSKNNIKYIEVKKGARIEDLAHEFNMGPWQFYKYNDLDKIDRVASDGIIYLQPKKSKAKEEFHTVAEGESMWEISQKYGIKLKKLYKKNRMLEGEEPKAGTKLYLRKKKPN